MAGTGWRMESVETFMVRRPCRCPGGGNLYLVMGVEESPATGDDARFCIKPGKNFHVMPQMAADGQLALLDLMVGHDFKDIGVAVAQHNGRVGQCQGIAAAYVDFALAKHACARRAARSQVDIGECLAAGGFERRRNHADLAACGAAIAEP